MMTNIVMLVRYIYQPNAIMAAFVIQARLEGLGIRVITEQGARYPEQNVWHLEQDSKRPDFVLAMGSDDTIPFTVESARK